MQTNEFVGQVEHGSRRPQAEQALTGTRETPETRALGMAADESRRRAVRQPTPKPHRYGAGF
jgi:hypothetical protein